MSSWTVNDQSSVRVGVASRPAIADPPAMSTKDRVSGARPLKPPPNTVRYRSHVLGVAAWPTHPYSPDNCGLAEALLGRSVIVAVPAHKTGNAFLDWRGRPKA